MNNHWNHVSHVFTVKLVISTGRLLHDVHFIFMQLNITAICNQINLLIIKLFKCYAISET